MQLNEAARRAISAELTQRGISQRALARMLGWSQTYLQNRILGRYPFTTTELEEVARALEIPVAQLIPVETKASA